MERKKDPNKDSEASTKLGKQYTKLTTCVYQTSNKERCTGKNWIKKIGRVVSEATKALFEKHAREF